MSPQVAPPLTLAVATVAMTPDLQPQVNRGRIRQIIGEAKRAHPDTRLVLFGETILGWFYKQGETRAYHESIAEEIPGPTTGFVADLAKAHDLYVSFGLTERAQGALFNAQVLISPAGEITAVHRKFRIRNKIFSAGDRELTTADVDGAKVALLICADARSLRLRRLIRRDRVDLVLVSFADYGTNLWLSRLMGTLYDAWTVVANRYGEEPPLMWHGLVTISDPWGRLCASGQGSPQTLHQRPEITRPNRFGRGVRRAITGFRAVGLAASLVAEMTWKSIAKGR